MLATLRDDFHLERSQSRHESAANISAMPTEILGLWNKANGPETNPVISATRPTNMIILGTTGKPLRILINPKNPFGPFAILRLRSRLGFYHGPGAPGLTSQCRALFTLERKLVLYVNSSFRKHKSRMVTAFAGREPFPFYASYLMTFRVFGVMRDIIYSRFGNDIAGLVGHSWAPRCGGFYHARSRHCPLSRHLTYNRGK
jgi:hypothetical protein